MSRPFPPRPSSFSGPFVRVNGKIRAREVRVIGVDNKQLGVLSLGDALTMARAAGVDLVEVAPNANPPVCRLVDFGKYRYEQAKRDKDSRKNQHATRVKEVQLSPKIDPHDLSVKIQHSIGFLCEDMKVKITLKFRGREMAHTEFGFQVVRKFLAEIAPYGHEDFDPKLIGRGINVMISPLPRNKRAKNPFALEGSAADLPDEPDVEEGIEEEEDVEEETQESSSVEPAQQPVRIQRGGKGEPSNSEQGSFSNNPFSQLDIKK